MAGSKWEKYATPANKWDQYASEEPDVPVGLKGMDLPNPGLTGLNKARTAAESSMAPRAYLADPMPGSRPVAYDPTETPGPTLPGGVHRVIHGVEHTAQPGLDAKAKGASEVVRGLGEAAAPLAAPAFLAAPAATVGAGLLGLGAQSGTEAGLNALGAPPGVSSLAGDAAGLVGGGLGGKTLGKLPNLADDFLHVNTRKALVKAYAPGANDPYFAGRAPFDDDVMEGLPTAAAHIQHAHNGQIHTNEQVLTAAKQALNGHKQAYNRWVGNAKAQGVTHIDGTALVDATKEAIPARMWQEEPEAAQKILADATRAYGGKQIPLDNAQAILKNKTEDLRSVYNAAKAGKSVPLNGSGVDAVEKAQRDRLADTIYKTLDPKNAGAGPREIKMQESHMIDLLKAAERKRNSIVASQPVSKAEAVKKAGTKVINLAGKVVQGKLGELNPGEKANDALVKQAFRNVGPAPALPEPYAFPQPKALLGPGAMQMPPTADQSGPFSAPPPMPQASTRMLPPPTQFQQPGFAVASDLVPIRDPKTGQITYQPQWMQQSAGPAPLK